MKLFKSTLSVFLILSFCCISYGASAVKIFDRSGVPQGLAIADRGEVTVFVEYARAIPIQVYLYKTIAIPVLSSTGAIGDETINVVSSTGVVAGHVITFYEGIRMLQSLVISTTATTIVLASPLDYAFTSEAIIESGLWSMNVDGSSADQIFSIKAPPGASLALHTVNCSMLDASDMDDGKFGGMAALAPENALIFQFVNGFTKHLALLINNIGFWEIGFEVEYSDKAPAGQYGFRARRDVSRVNGVTVELAAGGASQLQVVVRGDYAALDLLAVVVIGHLTNY